MSAPHRLFAAALLTLTVAACADGTAPLAEAPGPQLEVTSGTESSQHVLRQAPLAPPLETYDVSFWALRGTNRSIEVRYQNGKPNAGTGDRFVRFTVPDGALVTGPDGSRLKGRDSVLITLRFDATDFLIDFEPSGLTFARSTPATLEVWYGNADPDANRDGIVDDADALIFGRLLGMYHFTTTGSPWEQVRSKNEVSFKTIIGEINGFSGYAVSW